MRILIVDDDADIRDLLAESFVNAGFTVLQAGDGDAAWDVLAKETVDAVLTDIVMAPIDGFELCVRIRESWPDMPVFFMTGHPGRLSDANLLTEVFEDVLMKPFSHELAIAKILAALSKE